MEKGHYRQGDFLKVKGTCVCTARREEQPLVAGTSGPIL